MVSRYRPWKAEASAWEAAQHPLDPAGPRGMPVLRIVPENPERDSDVPEAFPAGNCAGDTAGVGSYRA